MSIANGTNINVVIADDKEIIRVGLREMIERDSHFTIIEEADNGEDLVELAEYYSPDIVLVDLNVSRLDGCEAAKLIKKQNPNIKVVLYVCDDGTEVINSRIDSCTDGLISKYLSGEELVNSLLRVANGEKIKQVTCQSCFRNFYIEENVA